MKRDNGENRKHHYILSAKSAEINGRNPSNTVRNSARVLAGISGYTLLFVSVFLLISVDIWQNMHKLVSTLKYFHCMFCIYSLIFILSEHFGNVLSLSSKLK